MAADEKSEDRLILMAVITKPQGIGGQMRLKFFSGQAADLARYSCFYDKSGKAHRVKSFAVHGGIPVIALDSVADRTQAELMAGTELFVRRADLAELEAEDEFYQEDLLGLKAVSDTGDNIGEVSGFFNFGGGDLLELTVSAEFIAGQKDSAAKERTLRLQKPKMRKELIPFTKSAVPRMDIKAGQIIVNIAAAGLLPAKQNEAENVENI